MGPSNDGGGAASSQPQPQAAQASSDEQHHSHDEGETSTTTIQNHHHHNRDADKNDDDDEACLPPPPPTMTTALFVYWILPIVLLSVWSRHSLDTSEVGRLPPTIQPKATSIQISPQKLQTAAREYERQKRQFEKAAAPHQQPHGDTETTTTRHAAVDTPQHDATKRTTGPASYRSLVEGIQQRRPRWQHGPSNNHNHKQQQQSSPRQNTRPNNKKKPGNAPPPVPRDASPERVALQGEIERLQAAYEADKTDWFVAIEYAEAMRTWGTTFLDGGVYDQTAMNVYTKVLVHLRQRRKALRAQGVPTNVMATGTESPDVASEWRVPSLRQKSLDGLLCFVATSLGKLYFMANLFVQSEDVLSSSCLDSIAPLYLEAAHNRGSTRIVLGKLEQAAQDYALVLAHDEHQLFPDAYTGMVRILEAQEDAIEGGWNVIVEPLQSLIPRYESALQKQHPPPPNEQYQQALAGGLRRFHHALFVYHDKKSHDYDTAWHHLQQAHAYKLQTLPPFAMGSERQRLHQVQKVFVNGFWPPGLGAADERTPIFIIGFCRSGSTLLERLLDAHPQIGGLGENSVLNGQLDSIRQRLVHASQGGNGSTDIFRLAVEMANQVVTDMHARYQATRTTTTRARQAPPLRLVDKMLTNYFNVGFIHMLFPHALIVHVWREPMDTVYSAFKHDFPSDRLAYTGEMNVLAELYRTYRDAIAHWDAVLPGRVTHVAYHDLVHDTRGVAQGLIRATGLAWDEAVLETPPEQYHVNTYSTTQVRQQVYKDGLQAWKRYETPLQPLVQLLGDYATYNQPTTLPGYPPPSPSTTTTTTTTGEEL